MNKPKKNGGRKMSLKFTDENLQQEVLNSEQLVLVDFYADWCGPCKMMAPIIEELEGEYEGVAKVGKLDVDASPETSAKYKVMSIPTMLFFKNGEVVGSLVGAVPKTQIVDILDKNK